ncbi:MAG: permease [Planctomycetota bacterium]
MIVSPPTFESFLVTLIVTAARTLVESSPSILGGVAVASWLRTQATPQKVASIFSGDGVAGSMRTVLVGMTLPVCSIGILPVLRELRLLGLPISKLIVLGIAAPLLNPFSILFGLTVFSFFQYAAMVVMTITLAIVIGDIGLRFDERADVSAARRPAGLTGATRIRNLGIASSRLMSGRIWFDVIVTIVVSTMVLSVIEYGAFFKLLEISDENQRGPGLASFLTFGQYVSPSRAVIQFAGIRDANLSVAGGLAIYMFGTAVGGASIMAYLQWFGWRRMLALTFAASLVIVPVCYALNYILPEPFGGVAETTALDNLSRPAYASLAYLDKAFKESLAFLNSFMMISTGIVFAFVLAGLFVRLTKKDFRDDNPEEVAAQNAGRMAKAVPVSQLGTVAVFGIGVLFFLSAYIVYPSPSEVIEMMEITQVDSSIEIRSGNFAAAVDRIAAWDSAASKISIGATIRGSFPDARQRKLTRDMRTELHHMKQLLYEQDMKAAVNKLPVLQRLLMETKTAFRGGTDGQPTS